MKKYCLANRRVLVTLFLLVFSLIGKSFALTLPSYAPGSLIVKFTNEAAQVKGFQLEKSNGAVTVRLQS